MFNKYLFRSSVAALSALLVISCTGSRAGSPYSPDTTNSSRQTVADLAKNNTSLYALLLSSTNDQLGLLDLADNRVKISVTTGRNPVSLSVSPNKGHILVANQLDKTVSSFYKEDNQTITNLGIIGIGGDPSDVIFNNSGTEAYVTNQSLGRIAVLSILNRDRPKISQTIIIKGDNGIVPQPYRMAVSTDNNTLYVIDKMNGRLFSFKNENNSWSQKDIIPVSDNNQRSVFEDIIFSNNKLYISDSNNARLIVLDTNDNKVLTSISLSNSEIKNEPLPSKMVINTQTNKLYEINEGTSTVGVIDISKNTLIKHIPLATNSTNDSSGPTGISISANGQTVYVTNNVGRNLSIISATDDKLLRNIGTSDSSSNLLPLSDIKVL